MVIAAEFRNGQFARDGARDRTGERAFWGVSTLAFAASATVTIFWYGSMPAMGVTMPGGWTMSMAWMRMPGQTWPAAAASFVGMWLVMMVAMMLPSLVPMLRRYRSAVDKRGETRLGWLTTLVGAGYFFVWTVFGLAAFAIGVALASAEMRQPALARVVPLASGFVVLVAGTIQFTTWKANRLTLCQGAHVHGFALTPGVGTALRHGLRLGLDCALCCAGLMVVLLVIGVMDLRTMAGVTVAVSAERLVPSGQRVAKAVGSLVVGEGLLLITRAVGLV